MSRYTDDDHDKAAQEIIKDADIKKREIEQKKKKMWVIEREPLSNKQN